MLLHCGIFLAGSALTALTLGLVFCGARARSGVASGVRVDFPSVALVAVACFRPALCVVAGVF